MEPDRLINKVNLKFLHLFISFLAKCCIIPVNYTKTKCLTLGEKWHKIFFTLSKQTGENSFATFVFCFSYKSCTWARLGSWRVKRLPPVVHSLVYIFWYWIVVFFNVSFWHKSFKFIIGALSIQHFNLEGTWSKTNKFKALNKKHTNPC